MKNMKKSNKETRPPKTKTNKLRVGRSKTPPQRDRSITPLRKAADKSKRMNFSQEKNLNISDDIPHNNSFQPRFPYSNSISPKFENKFQTFTTFKSAKHTKRSTQKRNRRMERSTSMNRGQNRSKSQKREVNVNLQRPEIITSSALSSTTLNGLENENQILSEKYVEAKNAIFDKEYQLQKFEEEIDRLKKENAVVRGGVGVAGEVSGPNELQLIIESLKAKNLKYQEEIERLNENANMSHTGDELTENKQRSINRYTTKIKDLLIIFKKIIFNTKLDSTSPSSLTTLSKITNYVDLIEHNINRKETSTTSSISEDGQTINQNNNSSLLKQIQSLQEDNQKLSNYNLRLTQKLKKNESLAEKKKTTPKNDYIIVVERMKNNLDDVIHKYDTLQIQYQQKFEEQQINHQFKVERMLNLEADYEKLMQQLSEQNNIIDNYKRNLDIAFDQKRGLTDHLNNLEKVNKSQATLISHLQQMLKRTSEIGELARMYEYRSSVNSSQDYKNNELFELNNKFNDALYYLNSSVKMGTRTFPGLIDNIPEREQTLEGKVENNVEKNPPMNNKEKQNNEEIPVEETKTLNIDNNLTEENKKIKSPLNTKNIPEKIFSNHRRSTEDLSKISRKWEINRPEYENEIYIPSYENSISQIVMPPLYITSPNQTIAKTMTENMTENLNLEMQENGKKLKREVSPGNIFNNEINELDNQINELQNKLTKALSQKKQKIAATLQDY